jgi:hypothetical protein
MNNDFNSSSSKHDSDAVDQKVAEAVILPDPSTTYMLGMERYGIKRSSHVGEEDHPYDSFCGLGCDETDEERESFKALKERATSMWKKHLDECETIPMPLEHLFEAEHVLSTFVWYHRCYLNLTEAEKDHGREAIEGAARRAEHLLGPNIKPVTKRQFHFILGRLSAFREVLGHGHLDT